MESKKGKKLGAVPGFVCLVPSYKSRVLQIITCSWILLSPFKPFDCWAGKISALETPAVFNLMATMQNSMHVGLFLFLSSFLLLSTKPHELA